MKKILSLLLTAVMLCSILTVFSIPASARTRQESTVEILPEESDTYLDGTPVLDDETYVVVWTKTPDTEVDFDETFKSNDDMKILVNVPMAKGGCCPRIQFKFDESYYQENSLNTGYFRLFLTNILRRKGNSAIPFEIKETKVTVKKPGESVGFPATPSLSSTTIHYDGLVLAGDWQVQYAHDTSNNKPLIIIQAKTGEKAFYPERFGSFFSEGNLWIIIGVPVLFIGSAVALVIVKKKKHVTVNDEITQSKEKEDE